MTDGLLTNQWMVKARQISPNDHMGVGMIMQTMGQKPPEGWLFLDGTEVHAKDDYPEFLVFASASARLICYEDETHFMLRTFDGRIRLPFSGDVIDPYDVEIPGE